MAIERTLSIIKPDGLEKNLMGEIIGRFEEAGLTPIAMRMIQMSEREAEGFYAVHEGKPFFEELIEFMTRGPCVVLVLEGENAIERNRMIMGATDPEDADEGTIRSDFAIERNRMIMGATDPEEADEGTIRADFATDVGENTVHGSDSPKNAAKEIRYFFSDVEIFERNPEQ
ncbi:MAG: nucleoside-diphosphate kinase [Bradymonadaceae bacterium]